MESQAKYSVSKARSSNGRLLAFIFALSVLAHGLFFPAEVVAIALIMMMLLLRGQAKVFFHSEPLGMTDVLLFGLAGLSLLGLFHPIKGEEAWLEALRYLLYWLVYRWGRELVHDVPLNQWVRRAGWAALLLAAAGGFPFSDSFGLTTGMSATGRLNSFLGYANATGVFLAAVLLLPGLNPWLRPVLWLALISTGSRSVLGTLVLIKSFDFWQGMRKRRWEGWPRILERRTSTWQRYRSFALNLLGATVIYLVVGEVFRPALVHLTSWNLFDRSLGERFLYLQDGLNLAWRGQLLPQAGGWLAFPLVQDIPYWTLDPHSSIIRVLLNQGLLGLLFLGIWLIAWNRKAWFWLQHEGQGTLGQELKAYYRVCLFLVLHSFIDADFAFPVLGFFFWFLFGSIDGKLRMERFLASPIVAVPAVGVMFGITLVLGVLLFWNSLALGIPFSQAATKAGSREEWARVLRYDQTCVTCRRELAEADLERGNWDAGLKGVEQVLAWSKFDLSAYEWAQNVVWQAAESGRKGGKPEVRKLYVFIEEVPTRVTTLAQHVSVKERRLWPGYIGFYSAPHLELLAQQAKERTLQP